MHKTYLQQSILNLLVLLILTSVLSAQEKTEGYFNPVIPGFHPDPSVCRVGDDFYLVNSSFEYFPGVPIFHSRDLINWKQIGYCLTRDNQLPLDKCRASAGIYAPTIRHHNGVFYMITTNVSGGGNFIVTATNPAGEWSDPIWVETSGIDPDLFFEDGKVYVCGTDGKKGIQINEIDIKTGKRIGETRHIWKGTGGRYPEGPHIFKKDGFYYLLLSEGGTEYGHKVTIARSQELMGPYVGNPANPILTHKDELKQDSPIQGTGHADFVQAADGSFWMVFLAFRPATGRHHILGRETFLAPVVWMPNSWPVVNGNGTVELQMDVKTLPQVFVKNEFERVEFDKPELDLSWNYLRNPVRENYSLTEKLGAITLKATEVGLQDEDTPTFIGRRQQHFNFEATTELEFTPNSNNDEAGLTVLMNNKHHYKLTVTRQDGNRKIAIHCRLGGFYFPTGQSFDLDEGTVKLRVTGTNNYYAFWYAQGNSEFKELGKCDAYLLSSETAGGFTGVYIGLFASANGYKTSAKAYFNWFEYKPLK